MKHMTDFGLLVTNIRSRLTQYQRRCAVEIKDKFVNFNDIIV